MGFSGGWAGYSVINETKSEWDIYRLERCSEISLYLWCLVSCSEFKKEGVSIEDPECQSTLLLFSPLDLQSSLTIFRSTTAIVFLVYKPCLDNSDRGSHKSIDNLTLATIKIFILNHRSKNSIIAIVILIINRALGVPPLNGLTYYGLRRFSLQCSSFLRSQCPIQSSRIFSQW